MERDHGRIVSVSTRTLGSVLDGDHAASATSLVLFDAGDFDETGGTLNINGATLAYASVDDDAATITLTDPLPADALDGDFVAVWDTLYDTASTAKTAMVQLDGDDDNPDPIECTVPHYLADKIDDGDRGGPGESVVVGYDEDEDEWRILDVRGLADASGAGEKFEADDFHTITAADITAGTATFPLSHTPIQDSLKAWCGIPQPPTEFTIDYDAATITFPLAGFEEAGDEIWVHYAYRDGPISRSTDPIYFGADGWRYLQVAKTDDTDYSASGFDDSTWAIGTAAFGSGTSGTWAAPVTNWDTTTRLWLRRNVAAVAGEPITIQVRTEVYAMFWNGAQISAAGDASIDVPLTEYSVTVSGDQVRASNVLAIQATDDVVSPGIGGQTYLDAQVAPA